MKKTAIDVLTSTPALPPDVVADADHDPFFPSMYPSEAYDTLERLTMRLPRYNFSGGGDVDVRFKHALDAQTPLVSMRWQASNDRSDAAADALSYRLEALVVRRRMEAMLRRTGQVTSPLYLGSLESIGERMNVAEHVAVQALLGMCQRYKELNGKTTGTPGRLRHIFYAPPNYTLSVGSDELDSNPSVTPVWLGFEKWHVKSLEVLPPRPFDYDFAYSLAPAALRAYEVLSYRMLERMQAGESAISISYYELCYLLAQPRRTSRREAEAQMRELCQPLVASTRLGTLELTAVDDEDRAGDNRDNNLREHQSAKSNAGKSRSRNAASRWRFRAQLGAQATDDYRAFMLDEGEEDAEGAALVPPDFSKAMSPSMDDLWRCDGDWKVTVSYR